MEIGFLSIGQYTKELFNSLNPIIQYKIVRYFPFPRSFQLFQIKCYLFDFQEWFILLNDIPNGCNRGC